MWTDRGQERGDTMSDEQPVGFEDLAGGVRRGAPEPGSTTAPDPTPSAVPSTEAAPQPDIPAAPAVAAQSDDAPSRRPESSDALTPERLLRRRRTVPESGWRRAAYKMTGGRWNPGDSPEVRERIGLESRALARISGETRFVAVLARKGGVGKTTTTITLGKNLAELRPDQVAALDGNPDRGTLADRTEKNTTATVQDLVASAQMIDGYPAMSKMVNRDAVTRLDVIASETDPHKARAFGAGDYKTATDVLSGFYNIVLTDCGTDFTHEVMTAILSRADAIVVVAGAAVDEATLGSETLDMVDALGFPHLAANAVVVVQSASQTPVNVTEILHHFDSRARAVVRIPRDEHLAEGSAVDLDRLAPATRRAILELAAAVIDEVSDVNRKNR